MNNVYHFNQEVSGEKLQS